ncbi:SERTA domain-containing protein 3 [Sciurus carolinensis]|uniref:SERTA domain-containing protein 3 n=1 Tax=Sciurus carolinensis TaxID=30640 RepID=A0AA41T6G1_SCICA|nr:SERTA domain-containing protein 3 [Sciurus carolinensis]
MGSTHLHTQMEHFSAMLFSLIFCKEEDQLGTSLKNLEGNTVGFPGGGRCEPGSRGHHGGRSEEETLGFGREGRGREVGLESSKPVELLASSAPHLPRQSPAQPGPQGAQSPQACPHPQHPTVTPGCHSPGSSTSLPPEPLFLGEEDFSLSTTIGSILRELKTSMDETEGPQNPMTHQGLQNEVLPQLDPVFLEALSSPYLGDSGLGDFFLDMDTSAVEKEPVLPPCPEPPHNLFCAPGSWEWNELDHIMEIILGS